MDGVGSALALGGISGAESDRIQRRCRCNNSYVNTSTWNKCCFRVTELTEAFSLRGRVTDSVQKAAECRHAPRHSRLGCFWVVLNGLHPHTDNQHTANEWHLRFDPQVKALIH